MTEGFHGFGEAALLVRTALAEGRALGIEDLVLVGVLTSEGRLVVPVSLDGAPEGSILFADPEDAVAWIELADREDARAATGLAFAFANWRRARPQIGPSSPREDLFELVEVADQLATAVEVMLEGNPFEESER